MSEVLEIVRGLAQAAGNAYDGALDENGEALSIGLKREQGHMVYDSRTIDGFKVTFHGPILRIKYNCDKKLKDFHDKDFTGEIEQTIGDIVKYLKKEYNRITGKNLSLTKHSEPDILVQEVSRVRANIFATQDFKIGGLDGKVNEIGKPSEDLVSDAIKNWLNLGKKSVTPNNVSRNQPPRPGLGETDKG